MRHYFNKLLAIMEERGLNGGNLINDAKLPFPVIDQIYSGRNIDRKYVFMLEQYLGVDYTQFLEWNRDEPPIVLIPTKHRRRSEIFQIDKKTGLIIERFASAREAGRKLGKEFSAIVKVANGDPKRKTAYGFIWVWVEDYKGAVA